MEMKSGFNDLQNCWIRFSYTGLIYCVLALLFSACQQVLGPGNANELATASQASCGFVQNNYGQRVSWKSKQVRTFFVHPSVPAKYDEALRQAIKPWEDLADHPLIVFQRWPDDVSPVFESVKDGRNVISMPDTWDSTSTYQQAVTSIYWTGNTLSEADIVIDAQYFKYFFEPEDPDGAVHFTSLMLHEFGHALGLKHSELLTAVMWPFLNLSTIRMEVTDQEKENLKCEY